MGKFRCRRWIFAFIWMVVIFIFSHQPGDRSSETSSWIATVINNWSIDLGLLIPWEYLHIFIRKAAHLSEYFILGLLLYYGFYTKDKTVKNIFFSVLIIGLSFAALDEFHQSFIPGRQSALIDVVIDGMGLGLSLLAIKIKHAIKKKKCCMLN